MQSFVTMATIVTVAYISTNVDGSALLIGFFTDLRYRTIEIVVGQFISVTVQSGLCALTIAMGVVKESPLIGLAGLIPLVAGFRRVAARHRVGWSSCEESIYVHSHTGSVSRVVTVAAIATSGAVDNVLTYAGLMVGRDRAEITEIMIFFIPLTILMCGVMRLIGRSDVVARSVQRAIGRLSPLVTIAIGTGVLVRFGTITWICSFL